MSSRRVIEDKGKAKACGSVLKKGYLRTKVRQGHLKMSSRVKIKVTISDKLFLIEHPLRRIPLFCRSVLSI